MDVSGERYVSPVPRVWDRPRPFYGCVGCVRARIHTYTYTGGIGEGNDDYDDYDETMHSSIHVYFRKGPTVAVQPRLPRRYLLGVRKGGVRYIILFSFSFEFFAAHKYRLVSLNTDLFSRVVTRFGRIYSWSWG